MRTFSPEDSIERELRWLEYARRLRADALARLTEAQTEQVVGYARRLFVQDVPVIFDDVQLCALLQIDLRTLDAMSYGTSSFYRKFKISKRSGGHRVICEPSPLLKAIQRWILDEILSRQWVHPMATGFLPGRSIKTNALLHLGAKLLVRFDIQDFFGSIGPGAAFRVFEGIGYHHALCARFARLCSLDGRLPQGAPSSPALSNLFLRQFDSRMASLAETYGLRYSRYADDITFSGPNFSVELLESAVAAELADHQLKLRRKKTHVMRQSQRMRVTGLVVNEKLQAPRELRRYLRQRVHYIRKFSLEGHIAHTNERKAYYLDHLLGIAGFVCYVNPSDRESRANLEYLRAEKARLMGFANLSVVED